MPLGFNRVLGDRCASPANRPHRVVLANWTASVNDARTASLDRLLRHVASSGYEGLEFGVANFRPYFPGESDAAVAKKARRAVESAGLAVVGSTLHAADQAMRGLHWLDEQREQMKLVRELGAGFASYQMFLHPHYLHTGGIYRDDEGYLRWVAERVRELRDTAWELGLNFYLEVHVDRVTEDPAACSRLLELAPCELNGDMSHYLARGTTRGARVERVLGHVGHSHVRMARRYGDLNAVVEDPRADWHAKGATWQAFQLLEPALARGLSSRCLTGETGPIPPMADPLTQDAMLVPLYRAMARYADAGAQGIAMKVAEPGDLDPFGG